MTFGTFQETLSESQLGLVLYLDKLLQSEGLSKKMRYRVPFYDHDTWLCYINKLKGGHLELCFLDGKDIIKSEPFLDMKGRKRVGGLTLDPAEDVDEALVVRLIKAGKAVQER